MVGYRRQAVVKWCVIRREREGTTIAPQADGGRTCSSRSHGSFNAASAQTSPPALIPACPSSCARALAARQASARRGERIASRGGAAAGAAWAPERLATPAARADPRARAVRFGALEAFALALEAADEVGRSAPVAQGARGDAEGGRDLDPLQLPGEQLRGPLLLGSPRAPAAALVVLRPRPSAAPRPSSARLTSAAVTRYQLPCARRGANCRQSSSATAQASCRSW